ncbi:MAG: urease accessory protein UreD [Opitutaceae bacterium]|nr:urease accessory protein UreD [Opitutaceae bacterium]
MSAEVLATEDAAENADGAAAPARRAPTGLSGCLELVAAPRADGRTVLARQSFRAPFHLGKPYWDGRVLQAQVVNSTAGILAGDRLELAVGVTAGAALRVTTPAATRAFMMHSGAAECRQTFTVETGGWLEYAPEPLCPHRGCDYTQTTRLEIAAGGEAYWVDTLAPGRIGRGEAWAWRRLRLILEVVQAGEPILRERLAGSGAEMERAAAFFGTPNGWLATVLVLSPRLQSGDPVWTRIRALHGGGRWVGVTRLRHSGWIVRAIVPAGQELRDLLAELRSLLAEKLPLLGSDLRKL